METILLEIKLSDAAVSNVTGQETNGPAAQVNKCLHKHFKIAKQMSPGLQLTVSCR